MVYVFIANIESLPDALENPDVLGALSDERKAKIIRIKRAHERKQSLGAGLLLEYAKKYLGDDYNYNLSHSGDYVLCAASKLAVGCDLERIKEAPMKVARRRFCESEVEYLNQTPTKGLDNEFFRIWTIKESYMKMIKKGLSMGLGTFEVVLGDEIKLFKDGQILDCYIKEYDLEGYKISICSEDNCYMERMLVVEI